MIRIAVVALLLGRSLLLFAAAYLIPLAVALRYGEDLRPITLALSITAGTGLLLWLAAALTPAARSFRHGDLSLREGIVVVVLTWLAVGFFGSLPFQFSPAFPTFTDAMYESVSGFTTTGASVLPDVEVLHHGVQFWRCFSHWLGGLGMVMLMIAILPLIGPGTAQLYRAQFGGAKSEKLRPRALETARSLWKIYAGLSLAEYAALRAAGMDRFDAACHTFSTMGTGGFSTRTASVAAFQSAWIDYIIVAFMIMASINFARHYNLWVERKPRVFFRDVEVRFHLFVVFAATSIVLASLVFESGYALVPGFRSALFQVTSTLSCTGFATDDYEKWRPLPQILMLVLMFIGGNTGSTSGGLKSYRVVLLFGIVKRQFKRLLERHGVFPVRLGGQLLDEKSVTAAMGLVQLALLFNGAASLALTATGVDIITSISAVTSAMSAVGPGLGTVGPAENYGHLPQAAKWVLMVTMVAGRLEFYTFLVVLTPAFWRK